VLPQLCALARTLTRLHRTSRRHSSMQRRPWRRPARGCPSTQSYTSLLQAQIRTEPADVTVPYSRNTRLSGTELRPQCGTFTDPRRHQYSVQCHALPEIETTQLVDQAALAAWNCRLTEPTKQVTGRKYLPIYRSHSTAGRALSAIVSR